MKILIADDEPLFRTVLQAELERLGHTVTAVENGQQALELWRKTEIPVIITDWKMPEMDGLELSRAIRLERRPFYTYIVILTALGTKEGFIAGLEAGADDFIVKPFDIDQLRARLHVAERILNLNNRLNQLEGLLPVCSWCKKIRDDNNQWHTLDSYVRTFTHARVSHSICPECAKKHF